MCSKHQIHSSRLEEVGCGRIHSLVSPLNSHWILVFQNVVHQ
ncbi:unnamed protein product, partial [Vitis vinifera]|uniref:Uncharacterized protein n=1 Tax=Vitis vinifera TaxID=29760 RepID=D7U0P8_VITVI